MSMRHNLVEHNERPSSDYIHCCMCRTQVALVEDYGLAANDLVTAGFFNRLFIVEVSEDEGHVKVVNGKTLAETNCVRCGYLLGWKLNAVSQPSRNYRQGGFYMRLDKLSYWNDVTLFDSLYGGDNERNADHDGGANQQNADQDGDANEQVPNEQDLGPNEKYAGQDGDANKRNADQDGDANEHDLGSNEQNDNQDGDDNEQDLGSNEQNDDQDEDANERDGGYCRCLM